MHDRQWLLRIRDNACGRLRTECGQSTVEFALVVPVFLLFIFGILEIALIYKANSALAQAATDGAHVLAAQSSSGPLDSNSNVDTRYASFWQADGPALSYVVSALAAEGTSNIQEIDIYPAAPNAGTPDQPTNTVQQMTVTASADCSSSCGSHTVTMENIYKLQPPGGGIADCVVGRFYLQNPLAFPGYNTCALPWNGNQYSPITNQNGRTDQRCSESLVYVKITYSYRPVAYPLIPAVTLVAHDVEPIEPRQFIADATTQQSVVCSQFPSYSP
jgi:Flp pilus assembly protein TadG